MTDFSIQQIICYALGLCEAGFTALRTLNRKAPEKIASSLADFFIGAGGRGLPFKGCGLAENPRKGLEGSRAKRQPTFGRSGTMPSLDPSLDD